MNTNRKTRAGGHEFNQKRVRIFAVTSYNTTPFLRFQESCNSETIRVKVIIKPTPDNERIEAYVQYFDLFPGSLATRSKNELEARDGYHK